MSGPSRTYWRKENQPEPIEKTRINSYGREETYLEWDVYHVNHRPGLHSMDENGICQSNPGMDPDYYAQGPEHGFGGPQTHYKSNPSIPDVFPATLPMTLV